ncbi:DUF2798 domain-containing protein [Arenibacterium sp. LLYu02]|uniref:DUF2798 domain-containing protein n=1 Tax=Arenibacterium sp. LLYu02 TaxID=3404132 RepID=UPI003B22366E
MIPARYAPILFGFLLSGLMSFIVTGVATLRALGLSPDLMSKWLSAWSFGWPVAFVVVLGVAPMVRWMVAKLTAAPGAVARD